MYRLTVETVGQLYEIYESENVDALRGVLRGAYGSRRWPALQEHGSLNVVHNGTQYTLTLAEVS